MLTGLLSFIRDSETCIRPWRGDFTDRTAVIRSSESSTVKPRGTAESIVESRIVHFSLLDVGRVILFFFI